MIKYISWRIIDEQSRLVIVDENGDVINRNPSKEELKGLEKEPYKKPYTDIELLDYLKQFYEENGRPPMKRDFIYNFRYPGFATYINHFGSWNRAIEMAGLWDKRKKRQSILYTDDELLAYLKQFYEDIGRIPKQLDFNENPIYPSFGTYKKRFGSWQKALKLVNLDIDTMVRKGIIETVQQKGRLFEIYVMEHFIGDYIDVSGDNCNNPADGICPNGKIYDAKSVALIKGHWTFILDNIRRKGIDYFYLGAFDKNYKKLMHVWRIPGDFIEKCTLNIGLNNNYIYNTENMKEYEITYMFKDIDIFNN